MVQFEKIKLVIWDLDETFWQGTLSEENVNLSKCNIELIKVLTYIGIVNSICSKNEESKVLEELNKYGINDYFVFKSINWSSKGGRIKQIIDNMQLRGENVLFIDDNHLNLEEAKFYVPELMVAGPEVISKLIEWANKQEKKDINNKRLSQYKLLEHKSMEKSNYSSNEEFLMSSNIKVDIHNDCIEKTDRIYELVMRSNQLNFTKKRDSANALKAIFEDSAYNCGYVTVKDNFGDYGLVGFFAIKDNVLIHFLFSCRTLGMGIEQYVYNFLGRPELNIVGEVVSDLSSKELPKWINQSTKSKTEDGFKICDSKKHMVLMKGPCDLFQIFPYIQQSECIDTEFTYVKANGSTIESTGHTTHIVESLRLSKEQKNNIVSELPFMDLGAYCDNIFTYPYKVVILSLLQDCNLGVYKRKKTGERFAFIEYTSDITNPENYDKLINKTCNVGGFNFTEEFLVDFSNNYEFLGRNQPKDIISNLEYIRKHLNPDTILALMLGTETYYDMGDNPAYTDRHLFHKELNTKIKEWAQNKGNIELIDVNKYILGPESYYDHINHFIKPVYYELARDIVDIVNKYTDACVSKTSKLKIVQIRIKEILAPLYYKIINLFRR